MVNSASKLPSVYEYSDYRLFIQDWAGAAAKKNPTFSFRSLSKKAGFRSLSYIGLVLAGRRNLTEETIPQVASALNLTKSEAECFRAMVYYTQEKQIKKKDQYAKQLLKSKTRQKTTSLSLTEYDYISNWFVVVIRELANLKDFVFDPNWIAGKLRPHISAIDAKKGLEILARLNILMQDPQTKEIKKSKEHILAATAVGKTALINFHRQMIDNGFRSIERFRASEREIASSTIALSSHDVEKLRKLIGDFLERIVVESRTSHDPDCVYQLNIQLFPVTSTAKDPENT